jgi:predicted nucleic acid-binding protein
MPNNGARLPFLDTNILLYAFGDDARAAKARQVLDQPFEIGVQSLNEFANVSRRKFAKGWPEIEDCLADIIQASSRIHPLTLSVHIKGVSLIEEYGFQIFDAFLLAAALSAGAKIFFSEDMQDGMMIENRMTIRNPFA